MSIGDRISRHMRGLQTTINNFENFLVDLDEIEGRHNVFLDVTKNLKSYIDDTEYEKRVNFTNNNIEGMTNSREKLNTIIDLAVRLTERMTDLIKKNTEMRDELNKNKLKFGLQGQIRSMIDKRNLPPNLPEGVTDVIMASNTELPGPDGGKRKKKSKTRKHYRRKNNK